VPPPSRGEALGLLDPNDLLRVFVSLLRTMHAWVAKGSEPAVFAFVLIDAEPVEKGGKKLTTHYPTR
jgi:hypothetical protein